MSTISLSLPDADIILYPSLLDESDCTHFLTELIQTGQWRQDSITIYGRSLPQPRLTAWYGDPGKSYDER